MNEALKRSVDSGYHPVGTDTIRSIVDHEFGHEIDALLGVRDDHVIIKMYKDAKAKGMKGELSLYADENIAEFIAEGWSESLNNPNPRPVAAGISKRIRELYDEKFK
jgi:hypothetical protein